MKTSEIISTIALVLSILSFTVGSYYNSNSYKLNTKTILNNNKPIIYLDSFIAIVKKDSVTYSGNPPVVNIINPSQEISFNVENLGKDNAKIKAILYSIDSSNEDILRIEMFQDGKKRKNYKGVIYGNYHEIPNISRMRYRLTIGEYLNDYYNKKQFSSNNNEDTIKSHILIIYENDLGYVYDTYVWATFIVKQPFVKPLNNISDKVVLITDTIMNNYFVNYSFLSYTKDQKVIFNNLYN